MSDPSRRHWSASHDDRRERRGRERERSESPERDSHRRDRRDDLRDRRDDHYSPPRSRSPIGRRPPAKSRELPPPLAGLDVRPRRSRSRSPPRRGAEPPRPRSISPPRGRDGHKRRATPPHMASRDRKPRSRSRSPPARRHDTRSRSRSPSVDRERDRKRRSRRSPSVSSGASSASEDDRRRKRRKHKEKEHRKEKKAKKDKKKKSSSSTNQWGKYGVISEADMYTKDAEFRAWLVEERLLNPETLNKEATKKEFLRFVEDFNTATLPHEKFYSFAAHERRMDMLRSGEMVPQGDLDTYDPAKDLAELRASRKRPESEKESYLSKEQLRELRKVERERTQMGKMKSMGIDIKPSMGVRMDGSTFDD